MPEPLPIAPLGGDPAAFQPLQHYLKYAQFAANRAPVMRLEESAEPGLLAARIAQLDEQWPDTHRAVLEPSWAERRRVVVLVSRDPRLLDGARKAEQAMWRGPGHPQFARAQYALGRLLGFPSCCVRALAQAGRSETREVERLRICGLVRRRPPPGQPAFLVPYVPCRSDCSAMHDLVMAIAQDRGGWVEVWAKSYATGDPSWRRWANHGVLLDLERPGELAVVRTSVREALVLDPLLVFALEPRLRGLVPATRWPLPNTDGLALVTAAGVTDPDGQWASRCRH